MTKTEIKEKYDYLKSVWHDTGIWTKISLEEFIREIAEIARKQDEKFSTVLFQKTCNK